MPAYRVRASYQGVCCVSGSVYKMERTRDSETALVLSTLPQRCRNLVEAAAAWHPRHTESPPRWRVCARANRDATPTWPPRTKGGAMGRRRRCARQRQQQNVDDFMNQPFTPREITDTERTLHSVSVMLHCVKNKEIALFELGHRGHHVSSRVVLMTGYDDIISARHRDNTDVETLVKAHILRIVNTVLE